MFVTKRQEHISVLATFHSNWILMVKPVVSTFINLSGFDLFHRVRRIPLIKTVPVTHRLCEVVSSASPLPTPPNCRQTPIFDPWFAHLLWFIGDIVLCKIVLKPLNMKSTEFLLEVIHGWMNQIETHQIINPYVQIWEIWRHFLLCLTQIENIGLGYFNLLGKQTKCIDFKVCTTHPLVGNYNIHVITLWMWNIFMFYWAVAWIEHRLVTDS